jgi:hypothetical protein
MNCVIIPLVKNKGGDLCDSSNYRAIAISNAISKLLEGCLLKFVRKSEVIDNYQFGFKAGHSTALCTSVVKRTIGYYTSRGSHVFACFVDLSKAFDRVNYWKLFNYLLDDGVPRCIVSLLAYWYSSQEIFVRWHNYNSAPFRVTNGTRQGSILSPYLFTRYIRIILLNIVNSNIGCTIGDMFINIIAYADDMVLLAPSWAGLQLLLNILADSISGIDMLYNVKKTVCTNFLPSDRNRVVSYVFPSLHFNDVPLSFVNSFRYLGHLLRFDQSDDDDIARELRNMFVRTNILIRKFSKCSFPVKLTLFRSYCLCMYDIALWSSFSIGCFSKLKSAYNKCIKQFFVFFCVVTV